MTALLRNEKFRGVLYQAVIIAVLIVLVGFIVQNTARNIEIRGIKSGFDFLNSTAGFDITESPIPFSPQSTHWDVFRVGLLNTLIVSLAGIILSTILGIVIGVSRLSSNWLINRLAAGYIEAREVRNRATPYMKPHSTKVAGLEYTGDGQERFYNNIFIKKPDVTLPSPPAQGRHSCYSWGLAVYDSASFLVLAGGNVYLQGARPYLREKDAYVNNVQDNGVRLIEEEGHLFIELFMPPDAKRVPRPLITTAFLGKTKVSGLPFENPDGSPLIIDRDYNGDQRNLKDPAPGPFLGTDSGGGKWLVWE